MAGAGTLEFTAAVALFPLLSRASLLTTPPRSRIAAPLHALALASPHILGFNGGRMRAKKFLSPAPARDISRPFNSEQELISGTVRAPFRRQPSASARRRDHELEKTARLRPRQITSGRWPRC